MLLLINIPTGVMMSFKGGVYTHGPLYILLFIFPYLEVAFAFSRVVMRAEEYKKRGKRFLVWIYFIFCIISAFTQLIVFPKVLISVFAVAIGLTFLLILMETPDYQGMMSAMEQLKDTQRQLKEQAEAANQRSVSKTEFLLHLSHELRTPLNAIVGYSEVILSDKKKRAAADDVKKIRTASRDLLSIAENIKNFIEIEDGSVSIDQGNYGTAELIRDMRDRVFFLNADKDLKIVMKIDPNIPTMLYGDRIRLLQLMDTLTANAVKYTKEGEVDISLEWDGNGLTFSVADTGIGMRPQDLKRIGDIFYKANTQENASGLGLGLAFATRLLSKMDSKLEYDSTYKIGSRFWFTVVQGNVSYDRIGEEKAEELEQMEEQTALPESDENSSRLDVLVVDDNQINIDITMKLLSSIGAHVESAMNGKEAVERVRDRKTPYDIIFMDHLMPVMNGVEAMEYLRRGNLCPATPVIALTANAVTDVEREYSSHGFAGYLLKPASKNDLLEMIRRYCKKERNPVTDNVAAARGNKLYRVPEVKRGTGTDEADGKETEAEQKKSRMERLSEILNTESGLMYCGGMQDFYIEIIGDYINEDKRAGLEKDLSENDFDNYRIGVHSLKSSSRTIGADSISEQAKQLEDACKSGDRDFIAKNHDNVMKNYGILIDQLKDALKDDEPEEDNREAAGGVEAVPDTASETPAPVENEKTDEPEEENRLKVLLAVSFGVERDVLSYLIGKDYEVIEAPDRETAFERYREEKPDLCIVDSEMTKGYENAFSEIAAPVIYITDERDRAAKIRSLSCGGADIIERPIDERFIKKRITSVMSLRGKKYDG
ncbi:MAG: response regulator [Candidatus Weimeria sp.]